ncbi:hypothetical protein [Burkholderia pseudomallei]|nr:hypothetical protein [Burkholderia pseudomallei]
MDDFGNSIDNCEFLTREVIWKRIYFFTGSLRQDAPAYATDNAI